MTRAAIALVAGALLVPTLTLRAAPLDKDECTKLKTEQSQLEQAGTRGGMGRGPEWAKANLAPEKLQQIRRLIEVDEQILFRCQGRPLVNLRETDPQLPPAEGKEAPKRPVAKAAKTPDAEKAQKKAPAAVKKAATPPPVDAAKAPVAPAAKKAAPIPPAPPAKEGKEGEDKKAAAAKAAKAKPKAKVDDAYRPPAAEWSANPFADQLAPAAKK
jgi:hypothetical protein